MTVYVDDARIPAAVGRVRGLWSHLFADTEDELHAFAARLGLRRGWFQARCRLCRGACSHWHYDVTEAKRQLALRLGAEPISYPHGVDRLIAERRRHRASDIHEERQ